MKKQSSSFVETKKLFRETNTSNNTDHNGFEQRQQPRPLLHRSRHQDQPVQDIGQVPDHLDQARLLVQLEGRRQRMEVGAAEDRLPLDLDPGVGLVVPEWIREPTSGSTCSATIRKSNQPSPIGTSAISIVNCDQKEEAGGRI